MRTKKILISIIFAIILVFSCGKVFATKITTTVYNMDIKNGDVNAFTVKARYPGNRQIYFTCTMRATGKKIYSIERKEGKVNGGKNEVYFLVQENNRHFNKKNQLMEIDVKACIYNKEDDSQYEDKYDYDKKTNSYNHSTDYPVIDKTTEYLFFEKPEIKKPNFSAKEDSDKAFEVTSKNELKKLRVDIRNPGRKSDSYHDDFIEVYLSGGNTFCKTSKNKKGETRENQQQTPANKIGKKTNNLFISKKQLLELIGDKEGNLNIIEGSLITITAEDKFGLKADKLEFCYVHPEITPINVLDEKLIFTVKSGDISKNESGAEVNYNKIADIKVTKDKRIDKDSYEEDSSKVLYSYSEKKEEIKYCSNKEKINKTEKGENAEEIFDFMVPKDAFIKESNEEDITNIKENGIYLIDTYVEYIDVDADGNILYKYVVYATDEYGIQSKLEYINKTKIGSTGPTGGEAAGGSSSYNYENTVDTSAPEVTGIEFITKNGTQIQAYTDGTKYFNELTNEELTVNIIFDKELGIEDSSWKVAGNKISKKFTKGESETLTVINKKSGNSKNIILDVKIDTEAPVIKINGVEVETTKINIKKEEQGREYLDDLPYDAEIGKYIGEVTIEVTDDQLELKKVEENTILYLEGVQKEFKNNMKLSKIGTYTIQVKDEIGNVSIYKFIITVNREDVKTKSKIIRITQDGKAIITLEPNSTRTTFVNELKLNIDAEISIKNKGEQKEEASTTDTIKTGMKLKIADLEYYIVVAGDIDGDGMIEPTDLRLAKYILEANGKEGISIDDEWTFDLEEYISEDDEIDEDDIEEMLDVNEDGKFDEEDMELIKQALDINDDGIFDEEDIKLITEAGMLELDEDDEYEDDDDDEDDEESEENDDTQQKSIDETTEQEDDINKEEQDNNTTEESENNQDNNTTEETEQENNTTEESENEE